MSQNMVYRHRTIAIGWGNEELRVYSGEKEEALRAHQTLLYYLEQFMLTRRLFDAVFEEMSTQLRAFLAGLSDGPHKVRMSTKTKKKRQLRAQSRLALARQKQLERERRRDVVAHRAQKRWDKTLRQLVALGATLEQSEASTGSNGSPGYRVVYEGHTYPFRNRSQVQRWVKRTQEQLEEQQMSWAERHVLWMIENNCDDQGRPWPE